MTLVVLPHSTQSPLTARRMPLLVVALVLLLLLDGVLAVTSTTPTTSPSMSTSTRRHGTATPALSSARSRSVSATAEAPPQGTNTSTTSMSTDLPPPTPSIMRFARPVLPPSHNRQLPAWFGADPSLYNTANITDSVVEALIRGRSLSLADRSGVTTCSGIDDRAFSVSAAVGAVVKTENETTTTSVSVVGVRHTGQLVLLDGSGEVVVLQGLPPSYNQHDSGTTVDDFFSFSSFGNSSSVWRDRRLRFKNISCLHQLPAREGMTTTTTTTMEFLVCDTEVGLFHVAVTMTSSFSVESKEYSVTVSTVVALRYLQLNNSNPNETASTSTSDHGAPSVGCHNHSNTSDRYQLKDALWWTPSSTWSASNQQQEVLAVLAEPSSGKTFLVRPTSTTAATVVRELSPQQEDGQQSHYALTAAVPTATKTSVLFLLDRNNRTVTTFNQSVTNNSFSQGSGGSLSMLLSRGCATTAARDGLLFLEEGNCLLQDPLAMLPLQVQHQATNTSSSSSSQETTTVLAILDGPHSLQSSTTSSTNKTTSTMTLYLVSTAGVGSTSVSPPPVVALELEVPTRQSPSNGSSSHNARSSATVSQSLSTPLADDMASGSKKKKGIANDEELLLLTIERADMLVTEWPKDHITTTHPWCPTSQNTTQQAPSALLNITILLHFKVKSSGAVSTVVLTVPLLATDLLPLVVDRLESDVMGCYAANETQLRVLAPPSGPLSSPGTASPSFRCSVDQNCPEEERHSSIEQTRWQNTPHTFAVVNKHDGAGGRPGFAALQDDCQCVAENTAYRGSPYWYANLYVPYDIQKVLSTSGGAPSVAPNCSDASENSHGTSTSSSPFQKKVAALMGKPLSTTNITFVLGAGVIAPGATNSRVATPPTAALPVIMATGGSQLMRYDNDAAFSSDAMQYIMGGVAPTDSSEGDFNGASDPSSLWRYPPHYTAEHTEDSTSINGLVVVSSRGETVFTTVSSFVGSSENNTSGGVPPRTLQSNFLVFSPSDGVVAPLRSTTPSPHSLDAIFLSNSWLAASMVYVEVAIGGTNTNSSTTVRQLLVAFQQAASTKADSATSSKSGVLAVQLEADECSSTLTTTTVGESVGLLLGNHNVMSGTNTTSSIGHYNPYTFTAPVAQMAIWSSAPATPTVLVASGPILYYQPLHPTYNYSSKHEDSMNSDGYVFFTATTTSSTTTIITGIAVLVNHAFSVFVSTLDVGSSSATSRSRILYVPVVGSHSQGFSSRPPATLISTPIVENHAGGGQVFLGYDQLMAVDEEDSSWLYVAERSTVVSQSSAGVDGLTPSFTLRRLIHGGWRSTQNATNHLWDNTTNVCRDGRPTHRSAVQKVVNETSTALNVTVEGEVVTLLEEQRGVSIFDVVPSAEEGGLWVAGCQEGLLSLSVSLPNHGVDEAALLRIQRENGRRGRIGAPAGMPRCPSSLAAGGRGGDGSGGRLTTNAIVGDAFSHTVEEAEKGKHNQDAAAKILLGIPYIAARWPRRAVMVNPTVPSNGTTSTHTPSLKLYHAAAATSSLTSTPSATLKSITKKLMQTRSSSVSVVSDANVDDPQDHHQLQCPLAIPYEMSNVDNSESNGTASTAGVQGNQIALPQAPSAMLVLQAQLCDAPQPNASSPLPTFSLLVAFRGGVVLHLFSTTNNNSTLAEEGDTSSLAVNVLADGSMPLPAVAWSPSSLPTTTGRFSSSSLDIVVATRVRLANPTQMTMTKHLPYVLVVDKDMHQLVALPTSLMLERSRQGTERPAVEIIFSPEKIDGNPNKTECPAMGVGATCLSTTSYIHSPVGVAMVFKEHSNPSSASTTQRPTPAALKNLRHYLIFVMSARGQLYCLQQVTLDATAPEGTNASSTRSSTATVSDSRASVNGVPQRGQQKQYLFAAAQWRMFLMFDIGRYESHVDGEAPLQPWVTSGLHIMEVGAAATGRSRAMFVWGEGSSKLMGFLPSRINMSSPTLGEENSLEFDGQQLYVSGPFKQDCTTMTPEETPTTSLPVPGPTTSTTASVSSLTDRSPTTSTSMTLMPPTPEPTTQAPTSNVPTVKVGVSLSPIRYLALRTLTIQTETEPLQAPITRVSILAQVSGALILQFPQSLCTMQVADDFTSSVVSCNMQTSGVGGTGQKIVVPSIELVFAVTMASSWGLSEANNAITFKISATYFGGAHDDLNNNVVLWSSSSSPLTRSIHVLRLATVVERTTPANLATLQWGATVVLDGTELDTAPAYVFWGPYLLELEVLSPTKAVFTLPATGAAACHTYANGLNFLNALVAAQGSSGAKLLAPQLLDVTVTTGLCLMSPLRPVYGAQQFLFNLTIPGVVSPDLQLDGCASKVGTILATSVRWRCNISYESIAGIALTPTFVLTNANPQDVGFSLVAVDRPAGLRRIVGTYEITHNGQPPWTEANIIMSETLPPFYHHSTTATSTGHGLVPTVEIRRGDGYLGQLEVRGVSRFIAVFNMSGDRSARDRDFDGQSGGNSTTNATKEETNSTTKDQRHHKDGYTEEGRRRYIFPTTPTPTAPQTGAKLVVEETSYCEAIDNGWSIVCNMKVNPARRSLIHVVTFSATVFSGSMGEPVWVNYTLIAPQGNATQSNEAMPPMDELWDAVINDNPPAGWVNVLNYVHAHPGEDMKQVMKLELSPENPAPITPQPAPVTIAPWVATPTPPEAKNLFQAQDGELPHYFYSICIVYLIVLVGISIYSRLRDAYNPRVNSTDHQSSYFVALHQQHLLWSVVYPCTYRCASIHLGHLFIVVHLLYGVLGMVYAFWTDFPYTGVWGSAILGFVAMAIVTLFRPVLHVFFYKFEKVRAPKNHPEYSGMGAAFKYRDDEALRGYRNDVEPATTRQFEFMAHDQEARSLEAARRMTTLEVEAIEDDRGPGGSPAIVDLNMSTNPGMLGATYNDSPAYDARMRIKRVRRFRNAGYFVYILFFGIAIAFHYLTSTRLLPTKFDELHTAVGFALLADIVVFDPMLLFMTFLYRLLAHSNTSTRLAASYHPLDGDIVDSSRKYALRMKRTNAPHWSAAHDLDD